LITWIRSHFACVIYLETHWIYLHDIIQIPYTLFSFLLFDQSCTTIFSFNSFWPLLPKIMCKLHCHCKL
jgi:hypothetical protein